MECIDNDTLIVTIAVQTHGKVIDLDLSNEKQRILNNVRLYSQSGDYKDVFSTLPNDYGILDKLIEIFQKDLDKPSINEIDKYIEYMNPKYKRFLEVRASDEITSEEREKVCRYFDNIIFDKSFSSTSLPSDNIFSCLFERLLPEFHGIFVVSIHKKISPNKYELIYPNNKKINGISKNKNLDLLNLKDFNSFANLFNKNLPNIKNISFELPVNEYLKREKAIEENKQFTPTEKKALIEQQKKEFFSILSDWNVTIKNDKIESIRMSYLIQLIKDIIGEKSNKYINLFDYSCNSITKYIPEEHTYFKKYLKSEDIEDPANKSWGGKRLKTKSKSKLKAKKTKRTKKSKRTKKY